jgi:chitinase
VRSSLTTRSQVTGAKYLLSAAGAVGGEQIQYLLQYLNLISEQVDFLNVMAYDFAGDFSNVTGHASNFWSAHNLTTPFSTYDGFSTYTQLGVPPSKLVMGCPTYGHSFCNTTGFGFSFSACPQNGSITEGGIVAYKDLPLSNAVVEYDSEIIAAWSVDASIGQFISYDNEESINAKLGVSNFSGVMWWSALTDAAGEHSLIKTVSSTQNLFTSSDHLFRRIKPCKTLIQR